MSGDRTVGGWVEAGEYLLLTSGEYSSYSVDGVYRAKVRFQIPGKPSLGNPARLVIDHAKITRDPALVDEVPTVELWQNS